jgi:hypothetical protein
MWHLCGKGELYTGLWWGNMKGNKPFIRRRSRWEDNIKIGLEATFLEGRELNLSGLG